MSRSRRGAWHPAGAALRGHSLFLSALPSVRRDAAPPRGGGAGGIGARGGRAGGGRADAAPSRERGKRSTSTGGDGQGAAETAGPQAPAGVTAGPLEPPAGVTGDGA